MKRPNDTFESVEIVGKLADGEIASIARMQLIVSLVAIIGGVLLILVGVGLVYLGFKGSIQWSFSAFGLSSKLIDASPGIFLMVVGIILIALNRFSVRANRK